MLFIFMRLTDSGRRLFNRDGSVPPRDRMPILTARRRKTLQAPRRESLIQRESFWPNDGKA